MKKKKTEEIIGHDEAQQIAYASKTGNWTCPYDTLRLIDEIDRLRQIINPAKANENPPPGSKPALPRDLSPTD